MCWQMQVGSNMFFYELLLCLWFVTSIVCVCVELILCCATGSAWCTPQWFETNWWHINKKCGCCKIVTMNNCWWLQNIVEQCGQIHVDGVENIMNTTANTFWTVEKTRPNEIWPNLVHILVNKQIGNWKNKCVTIWAVSFVCLFTSLYFFVVFGYDAQTSLLVRLIPTFVHQLKRI